MRIILFLSMFLTAFSLLITAQERSYTLEYEEEEVEQESILGNMNDTIYFAHELGVHYGLTTGAGFAYRYWWNHRWGSQLSYLAFPRKKNLVNIVGVTNFYRIKRFQYLNLNWYLGNQFLTEGNNFDWNAGTGPSVEFIVFKKMSVNFMIGYGLFDITDDLKTDLTGEFGLYFKLKDKVIHEDKRDF